MRIGIITGTFLPQTNGVISYVLDTATALTKRGHAVTVFAPSPRKGIPLDLSKYPFRIVLLPSVPALIYAGLRVTKPQLYFFIKEFRDLQIDIVHLNDPMPICVEAMIAAKFLKLPVVITFHTFYLDKDFLRSVRFGSVIEKIKHPLSRINANYHNFADVVICPSTSAREELLHSGLLARSEVIQNSIDATLIKKESIELRASNREYFHLHDTDHVAIFVGRLSVEKRVDILIKSWKYVTSRIPFAQLLIVGGGPQENALKILVKKMKLTGVVQFAGLIPRSVLLSRGVYYAADIYASASRIENQSISMIEAMAHGLPIVSINKRGVSELVDSKNGALVTGSARQLANNITKIFENDQMRKLMSIESRARFQKYTSSGTVKLLMKEYAQLVHENQ